MTSSWAKLLTLVLSLSQHYLVYLTNYYSKQKFCDTLCSPILLLCSSVWEPLHNSIAPFSMSMINVHFAFICLSVCECECYHCRPAERSLHDLPPLTCISMPLAHFHYSRCVRLSSNLTCSSCSSELPQGGNHGISLFVSIFSHFIGTDHLFPFPFVFQYSTITL